MMTTRNCFAGRRPGGRHLHSPRNGLAKRGLTLDVHMRRARRADDEVMWRATGPGSVAIEKSNSRYPRRTPGHAMSTRASDSARSVGTWGSSSSEPPERLGVAQLATKWLNSGVIVFRGCGVAQ